ncbi:hypothetical protein [Flammeovirga sp. SJP92]|uniref:hypothetical protein n=1 Tax=Flammeovirga sp. SJP92 TaxID=1775430 RepID=UPI0012FB741C|nr:hypothetical protein [Flammeovirga sp. SJP92]
MTLLVVICLLGIFYKHISFGMGLGDIAGYFVLFAGTITHFILTIFFSDTKNVILLTLVFLAFLILIVLKATLFRGNLYKWNGSIFYLPCPAKIKIYNSGRVKTKLIQKCGRDLDSEFTGVWDGEFITIVSGFVETPYELQKYISWPIQKVYVEFSEERSKEITSEFVSEKEYQISAVINAIKNKIPVLVVRSIEILD